MKEAYLDQCLDGNGTGSRRRSEAVTADEGCQPGTVSSGLPEATQQVQTSPGYRRFSLKKAKQNQRDPWVQFSW